MKEARSDASSSWAGVAGVQGGRRGRQSRWAASASAAARSAGERASAGTTEGPAVVEMMTASDPRSAVKSRLARSA